MPLRFWSNICTWDIDQEVGNGGTYQEQEADLRRFYLEVGVGPMRIEESN